MEAILIKLVILDVDGVLTTGKKYYNREGVVKLKSFCDKDWTAIKRFQAIGIPVIFITGDPYNKQILDNRNLENYICRSGVFREEFKKNEEVEVFDKAELLPEICEKYDCSEREMIYAGDDLLDIGIMRKIKWSFCPQDAPILVKDVAYATLDKNGGDKFVVTLFEHLEALQLIPTYSYDEVIEKIYELDVKEKF